MEDGRTHYREGETGVAYPSQMFSFDIYFCHGVHVYKFVRRSFQNSGPHTYIVP